MKHKSLKIKTLIVFIVLTVNWLHLFSQSDLKFRHISHKEGLLNIRIHSFAQDYQGFMWIGTADGLHKYDGYDFTVYHNDKDDSTTIRNNDINDIVEDKDLNLWVGTSTGVDLYNRKTNSFIHIPLIDKNYSEQIQKNPRFDTYYVYNLYKDKNDNIYVGTRHKVIYLLDKKKRCVKPVFENLRFDENVVRASDNEGNLWIASRLGAYKLNTKTKTVQHFTADAKNQNQIASNQVFTVHVDKLNNVWISTDKGLNKIDGRTSRIKCYQANPGEKGSLPSKFVTRIYEDQLNNIWLISEQGLTKYNKASDSFTTYKNSPNDEYSLNSSRITSVFVDRQKILWVGTPSKGINYTPLVNPYNFEIVKLNSLIDLKFEVNPVDAIYKDKNENLWIGTDGSGLICINSKTQQRKHYYYSAGNRNTISTNSILTILQDKDGDLWFGGYYGGINKLNQNGLFEAFSLEGYAPDSISKLACEIKCLAEGDNGDILIATNGAGLAIFNKYTKTVRFILHDQNNINSLCSNWLTNVMKDSEGIIWISTYYGLCKWDQKKNIFTNYYHNDTIPQSLATNSINSTIEDSNHNIWAATTKGLCKLNKKTNLFECYTKKDGLPTDAINHLLEDESGNLWVSTFLGISKLTPHTKSIRSYKAEYGLQGKSFKDKDGVMYFGSIEGFVKFNPSEIKDAQKQENIYFTNLQLFNKEVKVGDENNILSSSIADTRKIVLKHKQSFLTIKYVKLDFLSQNSNQVQYSYILEGFDDDWHNVGSERSATYSNLSPGTYIFKVRASDNLTDWNSFSSELEIVVKPPFWQTIWAYCIYIIVIGLIIYGVLKFLHIQQQAEIQRIEAKEQHKVDLMKLQFFTNVSHELRTPLTLILGPSEKIIQDIRNKRIPEESTAEIITRNASRLLRLVNQLLDFRKLDSGSEKLHLSNGDIVKLTKDIFELFKGHAAQKSISYKFSSDSDNVFTCFDHDKIEKVICNLLSNAIKFTSKGEVALNVEILTKGEEYNWLKASQGHYSQFLKITVTDTGVGIADSEKLKIFDSFYQTNNALYSKQDGTGIGLAIAREYVNMHDGFIEVEDNVINGAPKGSVFKVYIPIREINKSERDPSVYSVLSDNFITNLFGGDKSKGEDAEAQDVEKTLPLILIVEDNSDMRSFIRSELSDKFKIIEAVDGTEGLEKTINEIPDVVISDIMMGESSGIELCRNIKTDIRTSHIPVILLTALSEDNYKIEGLETGADDYLVKPFNTNVLKARILNLLATRKQLQDKFSNSVGLNNRAAAVNSSDQKFMDKLFEIISQEMENTNIDVNIFTREIGMSKTQLYKKVKALTGQSLFEFIYTIRLKKAAEILVSEDVSVSEAASRAGYSNLSVFTRSFTRQFKINPSKYASIYSPKKQNVVKSIKD